MVFFPLMNSVLYEVVPRSKYLSFPALLFLLTTIETIIDNHTIIIKYFIVGTALLPVNHANIVQAVKKCYKIKIDYRDLRWCFLWFCNVNCSCFY